MTLTNIVPLSLFCLTLAFMSGCNNSDAPHTNKHKTLPAATVSVASVSREVASNQIELVGTVEAVEQAEISSQITGNILSIPVSLGSRIKKGQLLVKLHAGEISAQVQQASAQLEQAKRNLAREEKLLKQNAATPKTVKSLKDTVRIAQAAFLEVQTMLNYTTISAPFAGIITQKPANAGDLATPGKPLLRIEGENNLQILTDIPEAMILKIKKGDLLHAKVPAIGIEVSGIVTEISPTADPSSRTTAIKIKIDSKANLRSGQFARITLPLEATETFAVPEQAILPYGQLERVFVAKDNRAQLRLVRTGVILTGADGKRRIEILSGLNEGETVVISGNSNLQSGQLLKIE
ncbi:MAG: efflux transporter periplasmic adaptor subunit [Desulfotalea sp.]|nr:MAG: efflux transporter periplasmic adaptor subunit [Desulfotalea sp.]